MSRGPVGEGCGEQQSDSRDEPDAMGRLHRAQIVRGEPPRQILAARGRQRQAGEVGTPCQGHQVDASSRTGFPAQTPTACIQNLSWAVLACPLASKYLLSQSS